MRTHVECDGVGPSKMNSWCHPGGDTNAFGGAVIVQVLPAHLNAGKSVRLPIVFPCVDDVAKHKLITKRIGFDDETHPQ